MLKNKTELKQYVPIKIVHESHDNEMFNEIIVTKIYIGHL